MVGRRRDFKQRAALRGSPPSDSETPECDSLNGPCPAYQALCMNPKDDSNPSCCSNLLYILDSACLACDSEDKNQTWADYISSDGHGARYNCTLPPAPPPSPLPPSNSSNAIPQWAFIMAVLTPTPSTFDFAAATSINNDPSAFPTTLSTTASVFSTQNSASTTLSVPGSSTSFQSTPSAPPSPPPKPLGLSSEDSSVQVGPIAGGIIAALVLLGLLGVGIWWYLRRRRRKHHMAPSAAYRAALRAGNVSPQSYQPVHNDSDAPENSTDAFDTQIPFPQTEDSPVDRHSSWLQSRPISIHSESRFREHTTT